MSHRSLMSLSLMSLALLFSLSLAACQPVQPVRVVKPSAADIPYPLVAKEQQSVQPVSAVKPWAADTAQEKQAVVQRVYDEVFNGKDLSVLDEVFDPNLVRHDMDVGGEAPGSRLPLTLIGFPDLHATVEVWVVEGNLVTAVVNFKGTHQGEYMGVAATGKPVTWSIIDVWQVKDGKITDLWHNVPNEDILDQIGATPAQ